MITLNQALAVVAAQLGLDARALIAYAAEDNVPGYYPDFLAGHIPYAADGKFLYALIRALKPRRVLESGTNEGGSATHIAMALRANGGGELVTVDLRPDGGQHIPRDLLPYVRLVQGTDICEYTARPEVAGFDFIHEDAAHDGNTVNAIYSRLDKLIAPGGGVIVSHDVALGMGDFILSAMRGAGFEDPPVYVYEGSPCGFSVIRYRGETMDLVKTTLNQALITLAEQLDLDAQALIAYAAEDHIGGFNMDVNRRRWATGSIWEVEGKVLFALVRAMKPAHVVEIGTWFGCGASHILEALTLNKKGVLTSIDTDPNAGSEIPTSLRKHWKFINARGQDAIAAGRVAAADLVFEDAPHDIEETAIILAAARDGLHPRLIISHDGMHFNVGANVREAYRRTFGQEPQAVLIEPSDCGFAWQVLQK